MSFVLLADADTQLVRFGSGLNGGIDDTAVVLFTLPSGQDEQTVAERIQCFFIHCYPPLMYSFHRSP